MVFLMGLMAVFVCVILAYNPIKDKVWGERFSLPNVAIGFFALALILMAIPSLAIIGMLLCIIATCGALLILGKRLGIIEYKIKKCPCKIGNIGEFLGKIAPFCQIRSWLGDDVEVRPSERAKETPKKSKEDSKAPLGIKKKNGHSYIEHPRLGTIDVTNMSVEDQKRILKNARERLRRAIKRSTGK